MNVKATVIAAAALAGVAFVVPAPANAENFSVRIGTNGYHHHHHHGWRHGWRGTYGAGHCRISVRHGWRHGHQVTVRKRVCY